MRQQAIISYLQNHLIQYAFALWLESPIKRNTHL